MEKKLKKGVWQKCKKGKFAVEYNNKVAKVKRRLIWGEKEAKEMGESLRKNKKIYSGVKVYKC